VFSLLAVAAAASEVGRPVLNRTNLAGRYDIDLRWMPSRVPQGDSGLASIFTALEEQLGLKLEPREELSDFVVIEQIERPTPD
jgi:uncharacterized protein (TIGR03435 family)